MADGCDGGALVETHAIENLLRNAYLGIGARLALKLGEHLKYALHRGDASQHAILFRQDGRHCFLMGIDDCQGGCVAGGLILQQRVCQDSCDPTAIPVHVRFLPLVLRAQFRQPHLAFFDQRLQLDAASLQAFDDFCRSLGKKSLVGELVAVAEVLGFELFQLLGGARGFGLDVDLLP